MDFGSLLGSFSGLSSVSLPWISGIVGIGFLIVLFYFLLRSGNVPSWREMRASRSLGYFGADGKLVSGRQIASRLVSGIKTSFSLAKQAAKGASNSRFGKLTGRIVKNMFREEAVAISEETRLMNEAAASWNVAKLVEKLANAEIRDDEYRTALDARIRQQIISLSSISDTQQMDEETKKFVIEIGDQITTALEQLAKSERFEVEVRQQSFKATREWVALCDTSSKRAANIEAKGRKWEKRLTKDLKREINELIDMLNQDRGDQEYLARSLKESMEKEPILSGNGQRLYEDYQTSISNIKIMIDSLELLREQSKRMVATINKVLSDLVEANQQFNAAKKLEKRLEKLEGGIEKEEAKLKTYAESIRKRFNSVKDKLVDVIVLQLGSDCAAVFGEVIKMMSTISEIDNKVLLAEVDAMQNAIETAYRAEEAIRIAEDYFEKIIEAYERFNKLFVTFTRTSYAGRTPRTTSSKILDLSKFKDKDISPAFLEKEINLEEMEERIAKGEENVAEEVKGFFIKTRNVMQESKVVVLRHIEFLNNLIQLTESTKKFILDSLERIITNLHQVKVAMNQQFQQTATEFQQKFNQARNSQTLERIAT